MEERSNEDEQQESDDIPVVSIEMLPLVQHDLWEPAPVIRPEYNIGKYAGIIFSSPYAKNLYESRKQDWRITHNENEVTASLSVTPLLGHKTPTTTTLRVYLGLLQIWYHDGSPPDGVIHFSARQLAHVVGWSWSGAKTIRDIKQHMKILSGTKLEWGLTFVQPNGDRELKMSDMTILVSADYHESTLLAKDEKFKAMQRVRLNPDLVANMLEGHVRPINYLALRDIGNDTTLNLYTKLDLYLSKKTRWERRSEALFRDELGLTAKRYDQRKHRRVKLTDLVKSLDGVQLMNGTLKCSIEPTRDGLDYKLVATKILAPKKSRPKALCSIEDATALANELLADIQRHPGGEKTEQGYLLFLAQHYPHNLIRRALSIAKADYETYTKSIGATFSYELERLVKADKQLRWYGTSAGETKTKQAAQGKPQKEKAF
jgi:hypothetical protein